MNADKIRQECLKAHNEYRALHCVAPLTLSPTINAVSQKWSEHLAYYNQFQHSRGSGYGENLAGAHGNPDPDGPAAVKMLYDEINLYNFSRQGFSMGTGHFTQVVWKESKELGIGFAKNNSGMWIFTFNYAPAGNMMGSFEQNVFRVGEGPYREVEQKPEEPSKPEVDDEADDDEADDDAPASDKEAVAKMSESDVTDWLNENGLSHRVEAMTGLDGTLLLELKSMYRKTPEFLFATLKDEKQFQLFDILTLTKAVKQL